MFDTKRRARVPLPPYLKVVRENEYLSEPMTTSLNQRTQKQNWMKKPGVKQCGMSCVFLL